MKIKLSRSKWEEMGKTANWFGGNTQMGQEVEPTPFKTCTIDLSAAVEPDVFAVALKDLCAEHNVKLNMVGNTIDV